MEPDPIPLSILALSLLTAGLAIAADASLMTVSRSELRKLGEEGNERAKLAEQLLRESASLTQTMLLLKTIGLLGAGVAMTRLLPATISWPALLGAILVAWVLVAALQAVVKNWVQARAFALVPFFVPFMRGALLFLWPLTSLLHWLNQRIGNGEPAAVEDDQAVRLEDRLRRLMESVADEDPSLAGGKQMITSILEMDETVAREVMVPRMDVVALDVETSLHAALNVILDAGHSRIPVYEEYIDHIIGFLYAKDLLKCFREARDSEPIRSLLRPGYFVPDSKKVNTLLREMQRDRVHIAMVVDEYGGIAGLVTIEDVLEEIVGEIHDEYDAEAEIYVEVLSPAAYLVNARLDVYSLAKLLDIELPDEDADTLGGLIYSLLGHVPEPGETVDMNGWRFTVLSLEGRRVESVRAEVLQPAAEEEDAEIEESIGAPDAQQPEPKPADSKPAENTPDHPDSLNGAGNRAPLHYSASD